MRASRNLLSAATMVLLLWAGGCTVDEPAPGEPPPTDRGSGEAGATGARDTARGSPGARVDRESFPLGLKDDAGREVHIQDAPDRILSLVPSATGILRALGREEALVGRTDYDTAAALLELPSVGGGLQPSVERVVSLRPDLVIRFDAEADRATGIQLDQAGLTHLAIRPDGIDDVRRIIRLVGDAVGAAERAVELVEQMDREIAEVREAVEGVARPRVAFLLGGDPPWVAGPGTFLHELLEIAGGENAFLEGDALYAPMSVEEIIRRDLDLIVALEDARLPEALSGRPVLRVPGAIQTPGHEVGRNARILARLLHPDRFPPDRVP